MLKRSASLDQMFQALADPTRRSIVERLNGGAASVSELAAPLAMSLAAVAQHIAVLEVSGLISTTKVGRVRMCQVERTALAMAEEWIAEQTLWKRRLGRLGKVLAEMNGDGNG
jgi:DNA-binding transcriptional ArsR family regulator